MFSYKDYKKIIDDIKSIEDGGKYTDIFSAVYSDRFVIMRHDVEFSVKRAYDLACFEKECNFMSAYFFQISNNAYNSFGGDNLKMIKEIRKMGHEVGLHFHMNGLTGREEIMDAILKEIEILSIKMEEKIQSFSIHRPSGEVLSYNIKLPGFVNMYQDELFSYVENMEKEIPKIKYLSDARHQWNYGLVPTKELFLNYDKIQILTHPYSWTKKGYNNLNNFKTLIKEKNEELLFTIESECRHFAEIKNEL